MKTISKNIFTLYIEFYHGRINCARWGDKSSEQTSPSLPIVIARKKQNNVNDKKRPLQRVGIEM